MLASVVKFNARSDHQVLDGAGHQDLVRAGQCGDSGSNVDGDAADIAPHQLALAGMQPGPDRQAIVVGPIANGAGAAADRAGGPIEGGQKAVASCLDLVASVATEFMTDGRIVPGQHVAPAPVTQLGSTRGRADDIGEQYGDQDAVRRRTLADAGRTLADAGKELLDLIQNRVLVPDPGKMVNAGKLDQLRVGDAGRDIPSLFELCGSVARSVRTRVGTRTVGRMSRTSIGVFILPKVSAALRLALSAKRRCARLPVLYPGPRKQVTRHAHLPCSV